MAHEEAKTEKLNMTPMIDVVFQLIVFFLVTMKFKTLDMKIEAFLPKDRGLSTAVVQLTEVPKLTATLHHKQGESVPGPEGKPMPVSRLKIAGQPVGDTTSENTWERLSEMARKTRETFASTGGDPNEVKGEVDAGPLVPTGHVIRTVDAFIAGGLKDVTFIGAPPPGSAMDIARSGQ